MRGIFVGTMMVVLMIGASEAQEPAGAKTQPKVEREANPDGIPFDRYTTKDALGRQITFYLSMAERDSKPLPLVVFVQGSGSQSLFTKNGDKVYGSYQNVLRTV